MARAAHLSQPGVSLLSLHDLNSPASVAGDQRSLILQAKGLLMGSCVPRSGAGLCCCQLEIHGGVLAAMGWEGLVLS